MSKKILFAQSSIEIFPPKTLSPHHRCKWLVTSNELRNAHSFSAPVCGALRKIYWSVSCNLWMKSVFTKAKTKAKKAAAGRASLQHQIQHCKRERTNFISHASISAEKSSRMKGMIEFTCHARWRFVFYAFRRVLIKAKQTVASFYYFSRWGIFHFPHASANVCTFPVQLMPLWHPSNAFYLHLSSVFEKAFN